MSWALAAGVAASAIGGALSSSGGGGSGGGGSKPFKRTTATGSQWNELSVMYNEDSLQAMNEMTDYMGSIAETNQNFYRDTVMPFQQQAMEMDTKVLPAIEEVNASGLESITKSLMGNGSLQDVLQARVEGGGIERGGLMDRAATMMRAELDNLPTLDERVGQAMTAVESQFSNAGKALARDYASRGQLVSKSDRRSLAIEKAKAKATAVGTAGVQNRAERMNMLNTGVTAGGAVEQMSQAGQQGSTQGLLGLQRSNLEMTTGAKDVLLKEEVNTGIDEAKLAGDLTAQSAVQEFGTRSAGDTLNQTSKGLGLKGFNSLNEGVRNLNPQPTDQ